MQCEFLPPRENDPLDIIDDDIDEPASFEFHRHFYFVKELENFPKVVSTFCGDHETAILSRYTSANCQFVVNSNTFIVN